MDPNKNRNFLILSGFAIAILLVLAGVYSLRSNTGDTPAADARKSDVTDSDQETLITRINDQDHKKISAPAPGAATMTVAQARSSTHTSKSAETPNTSMSGPATTEPLQQERYLAALTAMMEKDGKDNALMHYALAFELAPENPTPEQMRLIQLVMDEGWDERAEPLLPYLEKWHAALAEIGRGTELDYARGVGVEMGADTPVPNFLKAQNAGKILAVYSRYLASQGKISEASTAMNMLMTMGRDFNSPDNLLITGMVGTAIQSVGLKQISAMAEAGVFMKSSGEMINRLRQIEQGQYNTLQMLETEKQAVLNTLQKQAASAAQQPSANAQPGPGSSVAKDYEEGWNILTDYFSKPYWDRQELNLDEHSLALQLQPNYRESEARSLSVTSRLRQQQIDLAAQDYIFDHKIPAPDIAALVNGNYLPEAPVDPFTGNGFSYKPTDHGYELYGSGPNVKAASDPKMNWDPRNGTFSEGVIRLR